MKMNKRKLLSTAASLPIIFGLAAAVPVVVAVDSSPAQAGQNGCAANPCAAKKCGAKKCAAKKCGAKKCAPCGACAANKCAAKKKN